jgi:hypothetical protein
MFWAFSRAVGETMIVAIAAGQQPNLTLNPMEGAATITTYIVQVSLGDLPHGSIAYQSIFAAGLMTFMLLTLVVQHRWLPSPQKISRDLLTWIALERKHCAAQAQWTLLFALIGLHGDFRRHGHAGALLIWISPWMAPAGYLTDFFTSYPSRDSPRKPGS